MISKICNVLITIVLVVVLALAGVLLVPRLFGYQVYGVLSGSMEPAYRVGSVVYVKKTAPENIQVGDAITFRLVGESSLVATHRVTAIDEEARTFTTKGDNNQVEDKDPVSFDRLIGKAGFTIPKLGYLAKTMQTRKGILMGVAVLLAVILLLLVSSLTDPKRKTKEAQKRQIDTSQTGSEKEEKP